MNVQEFNTLLDKRIDRIRKTMAFKNAEYASNTDKLHNFKRAGEMQRCSPEKALIGMWTKHIISLLDIVDELEAKCGTNPNTFPAFDMLSYLDKIDEKVGDAINYLILLDALIKERYERLVMHVD